MTASSGRRAPLVHLAALPRCSVVASSMRLHASSSKRAHLGNSLGQARTKCSSSRGRRAWTRPSAVRTSARQRQPVLVLAQPRHTVPQLHLQRSYASFATTSDSKPTPGQWQDAGPSSSVSLNSSKASSKTTATDTHTLAVIARDLLSLLVDSTGRTTGKQRIVAWPETEGGLEEEEEWVKRLRWASSRAEALDSTSRPTVVAVLSSSRHEAAEFSHALLSDPLASDQAHTAILAARCHAQISKSRQNDIQSLVYGPSSSEASGADIVNQAQVQIPSQFLRESNVEVREVIHNQAPSQSLSPSAWTAILTSDIVIVMSEPTSSSDQYRLLQKPNVFYAKTNGENSSDCRIFDSSPSTSQDKIPAQRTLRLDIESALQANSLLLTNGASSLTSYSNMSLRAGFPQLLEHLSNLASKPSTQLQTLHHSIARLRLDLASNIAMSFQVLYEAEAAIGRLALLAARDKKHSEIELGFTDLDKLDLEQLVADAPPMAARQRASRIAKMSKSTQTIDSSKTEASTSDADDALEQVNLLKDGSKGVEAALDHPRLKWWKLPLGRADDVATELAAGLASYFGDLERKLIFETGRLSERAFDLSLQVDRLLKSKPFAPSMTDGISLHSATMANEIAALSPTTQFGFPPPAHPSAYNLSQTSLSSPILLRRYQLKAPGGPIEKLQLRAQQGVVKFYSFSGLSSAAAIYLNQTEWLAVHQDVPFCAGLAGLGIAAAAWHLQGGWKKAKAKFWKDWQRAQESLASDLQANADRMLNSRVFLKADTANRLLRRELGSKKSTLKTLETSLQKLQPAAASS